MKISKWFALIIVILTVISSPSPLLAGPDLSISKSHRPEVVGGQSTRSAYVPDELVIRLKEGYESKDTEVAQKARGQVVERKQKSKLARVRLPRGADLSLALAMYRNDPAVAYAEPNYLYASTAAPNDPYYSQQWALSPSKLGMEEAWTETLGSTSVIIAVIDSGVDAGHPDLAGKLVTGYDAISGAVGLPGDDEGHGTMVAGVAAAVQGNSVGISGVAPGARIMPVKVLGSNGFGTLADVAEGITWAADNGAKILNLSLGSSDDSQALREAVIHAYARGTVIVAAAGNNRGDVSYPAALPEVIAVTATNENDLFWEGSGTSGSNRGNSVDLSAPGVSIVVASLDLRYSDSRRYSYASASGTSLATPHVAGVAALIASKYSEYTNDQIRTLLASTAKDLGTAGWDMFYGSGRVDAAAALKSTLVLILPPPGDLDGDMIVGIIDLRIAAISYGTRLAETGPASPDLNGDGIVDIFDLARIGRNMGR
ncbi:MAG: S8 family serine peptidase [Bacillota bacterium]